MREVATLQFFIPLAVLVLSGLLYIVGTDATPTRARIRELARVTYAMAALVVLLHLAQAALVLTHN